MSTTQVYYCRILRQSYIKHVRQSFHSPFSANSVFSNCRKTGNEAPHVMALCVVFFNKDLQLHLPPKPGASIVLSFFLIFGQI